MLMLSRKLLCFLLSEINYFRRIIFQSTPALLQILGEMFFKKSYHFLFWYIFALPFCKTLFS